MSPRRPPRRNPDPSARPLYGKPYTRGRPRPADVTGALWYLTVQCLRPVLPVVVLAGGLLAIPLVGSAGAGTPQFVSSTNRFGLSEVGSNAVPAVADVDGDGDLDVLIGEESGNLIFFENTGTASAPAFAPAIENPFGLTGVGANATPELADLDGDGDADVLAGNLDGDSLFFENTGTPSVPAFAPPATNAFGLAPVGVFRFLSVPALADVDGDGDLDALIGDNTGDAQFFENTGTPTAPAFAPPITDPFGLTNPGTGSRAPSALADIDGDGDTDALFGHPDGSTHFFENTGTPTAPAFAPFAQNALGLVDVGEFSQPALADLDGDGDLDALIGERDGQTVFLENTGTVLAPTFSSAFVNPFGLVGISLAVKPALADTDGDGDFDCLIGDADGRAHLFSNTGTASAPEFGFLTLDVFGPAGSTEAVPALADLDGDGDLDAGVGYQDGSTSFFENIGTANTVLFDPTPWFLLADVGDRAAPALVDLDGDGDVDVIVGNDAGGTLFFENTGTPTAPAFAPAAPNPFALTNVGASAVPTFVDLEGDGDLDAFIGNGAGDTLFFENTGTPTAPAFAPAITNPFGLADVGSEAAPALADLDGDGDLDALIGNREPAPAGPGTGAFLLFENVDVSPLPGAACAPVKPVEPCSGSFPEGVLLVQERTAGKEKLKLQLKKGPALVQSDFGDPTVAGGTTYSLCLYDDVGALVGELAIARAGDLCGTKPCWKSLGRMPPAGRGYAYKDTAAASSGARGVKLTAGDAGKSKVVVTAANNAAKGQTALPTGIAAALAGTTSVEVQLSSTVGPCFSATLGEIQKQETLRFKAK